MTAAHPTLPIPSLVRVTNLENGRTVVVRLNDRGPFVDDRIIDLSKGASEALDMQAKGTAKVRVEYVGPAPLDGGGLSVAPASPARRVDIVAPQVPPIVRAKPTPTAAAVAQSGGFYVQAGSFADFANAHAARERLSQHGQTSIESAQINGSEFYRVMLGPWTSRDHADTARQRLVAGGAQALVVARGR